MDRIFPNRINGIIKARLKGLQSLLEESSHIDHSASKGVLREKYLSEFLRSVIPPHLVVEGGFICDVLGTITRQLDIVIANRLDLPTIALSGDMALIPIEAALLGVEVKSELTSRAQQQIEAQAESIRALRPIRETEQTGEHHVLLFVFAYNSVLSEASVRDWLHAVPELFGVCVLGKYFIRKTREGIVSVPGQDGDETLVFMSSLLHSTAMIEQKRGPIGLTTWRRYIVGVDASHLT